MCSLLSCLVSCHCTFLNFLRLTNFFLPSRQECFNFEGLVTQQLVCVCVCVCVCVFVCVSLSVLICMCVYGMHVFKHVCVCMRCCPQNYCKFSRVRADFHFNYINPQTCTLLSSCGNPQMFQHGNYLKSNQNKLTIKQPFPFIEFFVIKARNY